MTRELTWFPLDVAKADYGATHGAYINGITLLQIRPDHVTITGHMSCASREDAEKQARKCSPNDADRHISRATLLSWKA